MTFVQELSSWNPFNYSKTDISEVPEVGGQAPRTQITFPRNDGRPVVLVFLRHCGCPFAEKIFLKLKNAANEKTNVQCIAVSHSDKAATDKWLTDVGGAGKVEMVIDDQREIFSAYGLGLSSFWAVLNPSSLKAAISMGKQEGINIRPTESGSRWQEAGMFAVDVAGIVKYAHKAVTSDDLGDLEAALLSVQ